MWSASRFAELRDLALCRLTLFNGRRGNEPARIQLTDWQDAQNGVWLNSSHVESLSLVEQGAASGSGDCTRRHGQRINAACQHKH